MNALALSVMVACVAFGIVPSTGVPIDSKEGFTCSGMVYYPHTGNKISLPDPTKFCCPDKTQIGLFQSQGCCIGAPEPLYNRSESLCNGTEVIVKKYNLRQCGLNQVHNMETSKCKRDDASGWKIVKIEDSLIHPSVRHPNTRVKQSKSKNLLDEDESDCSHDKKGCCGGIHLDSSHLCNSNKTPVRKQNADDNAVCGENLTYNKKIKKCCNDTRVISKLGRCERKTRRRNNVLECNGEVYRRNVKGKACCGTETFRTGSQICCGSHIYELRPKYKCDGEEYVQNIWMDPIRTFFFKPKRSNGKRRSEMCWYKGTLTATSTDFYSIENKSVKIGYRCTRSERGCKSLNRRQWSEVYTTKDWDDIGKKLNLKSSNYISPLPKEVEIEIKKIQKNSKHLLQELREMD